MQHKSPHQDAEGNTTQWWSCHLPGAFGKKGWYETRELEQKELRQHEMAHKVVCFAAEYALLFWERVQLATLWIIPVRGMHMRQGAFAETFAVSQGVFGKAGMESARAHTQAHARAPLLYCFSGFLLNYWRNARLIIILLRCKYVCTVSETRTKRFPTLLISRRNMTSKPAQWNNASFQIAVLHVI